MENKENIYNNLGQININDAKEVDRVRCYKMNEVCEISLLIYLININRKDLGQVLSEYTGCEKEIYTESLLIGMLQDAIADISRHYHIPTLIGNYFNFKYEAKIWKASELIVLQETLKRIPVKIWSKEDTETIRKLKKEYIKVEE